MSDEPQGGNDLGHGDREEEDEQTKGINNDVEAMVNKETDKTEKQQAEKNIGVTEEEDPQSSREELRSQETNGRVEGSKEPGTESEGKDNGYQYTHEEGNGAAESSEREEEEESRRQTEDRENEERKRKEEEEERKRKVEEDKAKAATLLSSLWRCRECRAGFVRKRKASITIQSLWRGFQARKDFKVGSSHPSVAFSEEYTLHRPFGTPDTW